MVKIDWHEKLGGGNKYTYKELRQKICASNSSSADYIIMDLIASGLVEEKLNKVYQVKL